MANEALLQHHLAPSTRRDTNPDDYCNPASFKLQGQRQLRLRQALKPMHHHHLTQLDWKSPFIPFRCWKACTCGGNSKGFSNWPRGLENNGLHCNFLAQCHSSGPNSDHVCPSIMGCSLKMIIIKLDLSLTVASDWHVLLTLSLQTTRTYSNALASLYT